MLCEWDPHNIPILAEVGGKVRFDDIVEGETMKKEIDPSGHVRRTIIEHKGDLHPQVIIVDAEGKTLDYKYIPERASIEVNDGQMISAGTLLAKTPREVGGTQDITGGLPRVTELFEARRPKEPAVIAEIDGRVELLDEKRRGKRTIIVRNESGIEREHLVPHGKYLRVHGGDRVRAGDPLVEGPLVPHDILRISGEETVQRYLLKEIQNVYRSQRVEIDDKHLEIIIAQMLRKVRIESVGDTGLLPGSVIDKFEFRRVNQELMNCVKIKDPATPISASVTSFPTTISTRRTFALRRAASARPSGSGPSRRRPAPSSWGLPRRPFSPIVSSRPPASRRPPKCSPKPPWPARSTPWSVSRRT
jgi:DNA-directed RNA polymerase subunit beta'